MLQLEHAVAGLLSVSAVPATQSVQADEPAAANVPAAHDAHDVARTDALTLPAGQSWHGEDDTGFESWSY